MSNMSIIHGSGHSNSQFAPERNSKTATTSHDASDAKPAPHRPQASVTHVTNAGGNASPSEHTAATLFTCCGSTKTISDIVQCEGSLTIRVDGRTVCTLSCSADHPSELVVGHLFAEGLIASYNDIASITVDKSANAADVTTTGRAAATAPSAADAFFITTSSARLAKVPLDATRRYEDTPWSASWVFDIAREFAKDKTSHARTRGCHSAYLAQDGAILVMREDVGRHNAVDKVIGWALINSVDLRTCMLYTSGRVPTDMVSKAIRSNIPVLASKSVTTDKAAELARRTGLALLCEALPESFELISGNEPQLESALAQAI